MVTARQWRTEIEGVFGPAGGFIGTRLSGIDLGTVIEAARAMGIPVHRGFLTRVRTFESEVLRLSSSTRTRKAPDQSPCTPAREQDCKILYGEYLAATCAQCKEMNNARH